MRKLLFFLVIMTLTAASVFAQMELPTVDFFAEGAEFTVEYIVAQLFYFLPPLQFQGNGQFQPGQTQQGQAQQGQEQEGQTQQGQAQKVQPGSRQGSEGALRQALDAPFLREQVDPKLYLGSDQIDAVIPALFMLSNNPVSTSYETVIVNAVLEETLSDEQKNAWSRYLKEAKEFIDNLPENQSQMAQMMLYGRSQFSGGRGNFQLSNEKRLQASLDNLIDSIIQFQDTLS